MKIAEDNYIITEELTMFQRCAAHIQDQSSVFFLPQCKRYHLGKGEEKTFIEYVSTNTTVCFSGHMRMRTLKYKGGLGVAYQDTSFIDSNTGCFPNLFSDLACSKVNILI